MRKSGRDKVRRVASRMWVDARLLPPRAVVIMLGDPNCALSEAGEDQRWYSMHHQICEPPSDELARMDKLQTCSSQEAVAATTPAVPGLPGCLSSQRHVWPHDCAMAGGLWCGKGLGTCSKLTLEHLLFDTQTYRNQSNTTKISG